MSSDVESNSGSRSAFSGAESGCLISCRGSSKDDEGAWLRPDSGSRVAVSRIVRSQLERRDLSSLLTARVFSCSKEIGVLSSP